jgi:hypothetical protein
MKGNFKEIYTMVKVHLQLLKECILEISEMVFKMVMESSDGKMGLFIAELIIMANDKGMENFTTLKTQVLVEAFGKKGFYKGKDSMLKAQGKKFKCIWGEGKIVGLRE